MVLDTSALLALLLDEPGAEDFRAAVEEDTIRLVSAATPLETAILVEARKGEPGGRELDTLIQKADVVVVPVDADRGRG
jgi:ribonuclease VapC